MRVIMTGFIGALVLVVASPLLAPLDAQRADGRLRVEYTVEVKDTSAKLFHVTATFSNLRQPRLDLSLPVWTPGWYTIENYGRNILRFEAMDGAGSRLAAPHTALQSWSIDTRGTGRVTVEFDYHASVLAANQAKITGKYAFFTGTQLFLEPVGHRDAEFTVRFVRPAGWKIVSALDETTDSSVFTATDYDALVDAPTVMGSFDVERFEVGGKPHYLVAVPAATFPADSMRAYARRLVPLIRTQSAIFGDLPYSKYVIFYFSDAAESKAQGLLEHANSYVGMDMTALGPVPGAAAHEFFHLWNVKRIRPAEMWPYDYTRLRETPSLWLSEGVSMYYAGLTLYRAGYLSDTLLVAGQAREISRLESNEARHYVSPSDASMSTWLGYDTPPAFFVSYYGQGQVLGALLDLSIIHQTRGRRRLDDVMRTLYGNYKRGAGFTAGQLIAAVSAAAGHDYTDFFRRYVSGVEVPPYDSIFGYAGYRATRTERTVGVLGAFTIEIPQGRRVLAVWRGSPAALAGMLKDDVIIRADDVPIAQIRMSGPGGQDMLDGAQKRVVFTVMRGGSERAISVTLGRRDEINFVIDDNPAATAGELGVRKSWLRRDPILPSQQR